MTRGYYMIEQSVREDGPVRHQMVDYDAGGGHLRGRKLSQGRRMERKFVKYNRDRQVSDMYGWNAAGKLAAFAAASDSAK